MFKFNFCKRHLVFISNVPKYGQVHHDGGLEEITTEHILDSIVHYAGVPVSDIKHEVDGTYKVQVSTFEEATTIKKYLDGNLIQDNVLSVTLFDSTKYLLRFIGIRICILLFLVGLTVILFK
jgi:hypothetical protein